MGTVAKAEQDPYCLSPGGQSVAPDGKRRDAHAPTDQDGSATIRRGLESLAERAQEPQPIALAQLAQAPRAGTDVLQQEEGLAVLEASVGEGTRQVGALVLAGAPALGGSQHRELAGQRSRTVRVGGSQDAVGAEWIVGCDGEQAPPERGEGALAHAAAFGWPANLARDHSHRAIRVAREGGKERLTPLPPDPPPRGCAGRDGALAGRARRARRA